MCSAVSPLILCRSTRLKCRYRGVELGRRAHPGLCRRQTQTEVYSREALPELRAVACAWVPSLLARLSKCAVATRRRAPPPSSQVHNSTTCRQRPIREFSKGKRTTSLTLRQAPFLLTPVPHPARTLKSYPSLVNSGTIKSEMPGVTSWHITTSGACLRTIIRNSKHTFFQMDRIKPEVVGQDF